MGTPIIKSGRFHAGTDLVCGENVVVDVAEECVVGDRCVLPDNAYLGGRSIRVGDDFYGYGWEWRRLDVGRGRRDDEHATLVVGNRCTFHDNRLDLACPVVVRDDVGLSPEVAVYTHGYWLSPLDGYPTDYAAVVIESGVIVGFRSTLLPGAHVRTGCVVGAGSVVVGELPAGHVCAGVPCKPLRKVTPLPEAKRRARLEVYAQQYRESLAYRGLGENVRLACDYPILLLEDRKSVV